MKKSNFQMKTPYLEKIDFEINHGFVPGDEGLKINIEANVLVSEIDTNSSNVKLIVDIFKSEDEINVPFRLSVVYTGDFEWEGYSEDELNILLTQNAPAVLMSYVRALVATITSNSEYPPLHIPLMNFTEDEITEEK